MDRRTMLKYAAFVPTGLLATDLKEIEAAEEKQVAKSEEKVDENRLKLRPHHLVDIIGAIGTGSQFKPNPAGHAFHTVGKAVQANIDRKVQFIVAADDVCKPCKHLLPNGLCENVMKTFSPPITEQEYNDKLDRRLLKYLNIPEGTVMTVRQFLHIIDKKLPGMEEICTHPYQTKEKRLKSLVAGLEKLGIRKAPGKKEKA